MTTPCSFFYFALIGNRIFLAWGRGRGRGVGCGGTALNRLCLGASAVALRFYSGCSVPPCKKPRKTTVIFITPECYEECSAEYCPRCFAELPRFGHARTVTWHLRHKRCVTWHLRHKQYFFCPIGHDGGGHGRPSPHPDDTCTTTRAGFERDLVHVRWVSVETTQAHAPLR